MNELFCEGCEYFKDDICHEESAYEDADGRAVCKFQSGAKFKD